MPWSVTNDPSVCSEVKPWAVINDESGETEGCHETEEAANTQRAALYAAEGEEARSDVVPDGKAEMRSVPFTDLETADDGGTFEGYAAVFGHDADLGDFTESINRGAFRKSVSSGENVPMLYDHSAMHPVLATTRGGTLQLEEDAKGLRVKADVAKHYMGDAVRELVKRGDIAGMSFGFVAGAGNSKVEQRGRKPHRILIGFKRLLDVSPTWDEAYSGTEAAFRSLQAIHETDSLEEAQQVLSGEQPQLENGAPPSEGVADESGQESRSTGALETPGLVAARRRLQLLGLTLSKEEL